jgi:DNA-binding transcriptional LysR family regulator
MDHLTALRVFRQAAELGSFAAAARQLGLSPAAVSKNIGELEAHLSARLFNRTTRRMSLTEAGTLYHEHVSRILDDLARAEGALGAMRDTPRGRLRVSAPMTLSLMCLSSALPKFLDQYPEVSLELQLDDRRVDIVGEGFDIAVRGSDRLEDSSLIAKKLMRLEHTVCASPAYFERFGTPASPADLVNHRCVRFSLSGHADEWEFRKGSRKIRLPIKCQYSVTSSLAVRDALRSGYGLSLIPSVYVKEDVEAGRLRTVLEDWSYNETTIYAVYPSKSYVAPKVRAFLDFLVEQFAEQASSHGDQSADTGATLP